jgi:hypothetical protein
VTAIDRAVPSDADPAIARHGEGNVVASVVSMSAGHPTGEDAAYLAWHMLDHLPEQYRLPGVRLGQRWVSTPACRAARLVSNGAWDDVDHVVQYLLAEPVRPTLDHFFPLGGALRKAGRMPMTLPRVQVGGWRLVEEVAAERVLVGSAVVPWRPASGVYVVVEEAPDVLAAGRDELAALASVPGVAGAWRWAGGPPLHERLETTDGLVLTVCYLDEAPVSVASRLGEVLADRWAAWAVTPQLAAPFELVVAGEWDRHLP